MLEYPLTTTNLLTYLDSTETTFRIEKVVLGMESVTVAAGTFQAYKIQWLLSLAADIVFLDWISEQGLIKRQIVSPSESIEGTFDIFESYELEALQVAN